jgi:hypothetical protein
MNITHKVVLVLRVKPRDLTGLNSKSTNDLSIRVKPRHLVEVNK